MNTYQHTFHIPVMGLGYSADTPIRVAPLGISSVISITEDTVLEQFRKYYCQKYDFPYEKIPPEETDGRAKRITAYLDTVLKIVRMEIENIRKQPFFEPNNKQKFFELLPEESPLKQAYERLLNMNPGPERDALANELTEKIQPGSIDVNIMVKLDSMPYDKDGNPLGSKYTAAKAALRGYASSDLDSGIVFSAGFNQGLFQYLPEFQDFYRDDAGHIRKRIILKVSDFRSALIQARFLAKKGLEVHEFRIESGLNCGGHAFSANGHLLPCILQEFYEHRDRLATEFQELVRKYYRKMGWHYPESEQPYRPLITVQGGIGTHGEVRRIREDFGMDLTGWATPFLLVSEVTCVDDPTRELLRQAGENQVYLSNASPFGIPFNNVRNTGSERRTLEMAEKGNPGAPCTRGLIVSNTEFTKKPICMASGKYQRRKLRQIAEMPISDAEKAELRQHVIEKVCLCEHLCNSSLIALGMADEKTAPQAMCPGPNIAWFDRYYTLKEMVDHIYGRCPSLVPAKRPHMFAKEISMYTDYFEKQVAACTYTPLEIKTIRAFKENIEAGMAFCLEIARKTPYPDENLDSIPICIEREKVRIRRIFARFEGKEKEVAATPEVEMMVSAAC